MKKIILTLTLLLPLGLAAQNSGIDKLILKYQEKQGVMCINLRENIFDMISGYLPAIMPETNDVPVITEDNYGAIDSVSVSVEIVYPEVEEVAVVAEDGNEGDYNYEEYNDDYDHDFDYEGYVSGYDYAAYLSEAAQYIDKISSLKLIVNENANKKFVKDIAATVKSGGYQSILSMRNGMEDVRVYSTSESNRIDILVVYGDGNEYIVGNVVGSSDLLKLLEVAMKYLK